MFPALYITIISAGCATAVCSLVAAWRARHVPWIAVCGTAFGAVAAALTLPGHRHPAVAAGVLAVACALWIAGITATVRAQRRTSHAEEGL